MDKIICVGKNYLAHAQELGDAVPEKPVLFLKPPSVLQQASTWQSPLTVQYPKALDEEVHPECEIALLVKHDAYQLTPAQAQEGISYVTLGLDMTLRTRQARLKQAGHPWTTAKVFPDAAILAPWIALEDFPDYVDTEFHLSVNHQTRQRAKGREMMMSPLDLLVYISHYFPLCAGDIIFTGTPAGVASIQPQDHLQLGWQDKTLSVFFNTIDDEGLT